MNMRWLAVLLFAATVPLSYLAPVALADSVTRLCVGEWSSWCEKSYEGRFDMHLGCEFKDPKDGGTKSARQVCTFTKSNGESITKDFEWRRLATEGGGKCGYFLNEVRCLD